MCVYIYTHIYIHILYACFDSIINNDARCSARSTWATWIGFISTVIWTGFGRSFPMMINPQSIAGKMTIYKK